MVTEYQYKLSLLNDSWLFEGLPSSVFNELEESIDLLVSLYVENWATQIEYVLDIVNRMCVAKLHNCIDPKSESKSVRDLIDEFRAMMDQVESSIEEIQGRQKTSEFYHYMEQTTLLNNHDRRIKGGWIPMVTNNLCHSVEDIEELFLDKELMEEFNEFMFESEHSFAMLATFLTLTYRGEYLQSGAELWLSEIAENAADNEIELSNFLVNDGWLEDNEFTQWLLSILDNVFLFVLDFVLILWDTTNKCTDVLENSVHTHIDLNVMELSLSIEVDNHR